MRLARHPTRPDAWQVFDDAGRLAALGRLEVRSIGEPVVFVADWLAHEQEQHDRKPTVIGRG